MVWSLGGSSIDLYKTQGFKSLSKSKPLVAAKRKQRSQTGPNAVSQEASNNTNPPRAPPLFIHAAKPRRVLAPSLAGGGLLGGAAGGGHSAGEEALAGAPELAALGARQAGGSGGLGGGGRGDLGGWAGGHQRFFEGGPAPVFVFPFRGAWLLGAVFCLFGLSAQLAGLGVNNNRAVYTLLQTSGSV